MESGLVKADDRKSWLNRARSSKTGVLIVCSIAIFIDMAVYGVMLPIFPTMLKTVGKVSGEDMGSHIYFLFSIYALGLFISTIIFGIYSDKYRNRKIPMLLSLLGLSLTTVTFAVSESYVAWTVARFFQGVSAAGSWVLGLTMVTDAYADTDRLGFAVGFVLSCNSLGYVSGPLIGGVLASYYDSMKAPFYFCAILALLDFAGRLFINYKPPEKSAADDQIPTKWYEALYKNCMIEMMCCSDMWVNAIVVILYSSAFSMFEASMPEYLQTTFGLNYKRITYVICCVIIPNAISSIVVGYIADKISRSRIVFLGFILYGIAPILFGLANTYFTVCLASAYFGITSSILNTPLMPLITESIRKTKYDSSFAQLYGLLTLCYSIGMFVAPMMADTLIHHFSFLVGCAAFSVLLLAYLPIYMVLTFVAERKGAGFDHSMPTVFKSFFKDLIRIQPLKSGQKTLADISQNNLTPAS